MRLSELFTAELKSFDNELTKLFKFLDENCAVWFCEIVQYQLEEIKYSAINELERRNDE